MATLIESMTRLKFPWGVLRAWRQEENHDFILEENHREILSAIKDSDVTSAQVAQAVLSLDRMNAVEVLDDEGHGIVLYKDWP